VGADHEENSPKNNPQKFLYDNGAGKTKSKKFFNSPETSSIGGYRVKNEQNILLTD